MFTRDEIQPAIGDVHTETIWSVYRAEWAADAFAPKFYSPIQNNIGPNFVDGLNFDTCVHSFNVMFL